MTENYNYLFQYLEKERINIDYDEFEFQMKSHPDYPSVIAITDTLHFFNIDNGVLRVSNAEIELLPNRFIAFLKNERNEIEHYFVEKRKRVDILFCNVYNAFEDFLDPAFLNNFNGFQMPN